MLNTIAEMIGAGCRSDNVFRCQQIATRLIDEFKPSASERADLMAIRSTLEACNVALTTKVVKRIRAALLDKSQPA